MQPGTKEAQERLAEVRREYATLLARNEALHRWSWRIGLAIIALTLLGAVYTARAQTFDSDKGPFDPPPAQDTDHDGVPNRLDNCILVANPNQKDGDGDGHGNACDGDLNNDGVVNEADTTLLWAAMGTADPVADINANGIVNAMDSVLLRNLQGKRPGPSTYCPNPDGTWTWIAPTTLENGDILKDLSHYLMFRQVGTAAPTVWAQIDGRTERYVIAMKPEDFGACFWFKSVRKPATSPEVASDKSNTVCLDAAGRMVKP